MPKIDARHRITLPDDLTLFVNTDFNANLRLYVKGGVIFLDNPSPANYHIPCFGGISLSKRKRFMIPQMARSIFNLNPGDEVEFYISGGKLAFKRVFTQKQPIK